MKVVLDTNVLVSGTFWTGDSFEILNRVDKKYIECTISKELIKEYYKTINSNEIIEKTTKKNLIINDIVNRVINNSTIIEPQEKLNIITDDPDDNIILDCAVEGNVGFIVSQDKHLLNLKEFRGIKIVNPTDFLKLKIN